MALEVTYRERLYRVYKEVKNRLDYHIAVQNMTRRKEQEHMINWVEKHVVQSISAEQVHNIFIGSDIVLVSLNKYLLMFR